MVMVIFWLLLLVFVEVDVRNSRNVLNLGM
jgi:hypothetical protein